MNDQSPAPVAGAVEALPDDVLKALDWLEKLSEPGWYADRLGPLNEWLKAHPLVHPQPAPAVAVEAGPDFEPMKSAWPLDRAADMLTAYAEMVKAMGRYAEEHYLPEVEQVVAELNALAAGSAPAVAEGQWMPIETAPNNHLPVLTWSKLDGVRAAFRDVTWRWLFVMPTTSARPTHWQPLPAPPTAGSGSAQEGQAK